MSTTTEDEFLGGRLRIHQPRNGYRAGIDPVFLAASVPARPGESVLDLGTGVGVALLCLMARVPGLLAMGVERHTDLAELAKQNVASNGLDATIVQADLVALPATVRDISFDHVMANPPFFDRVRGSASDDSRAKAGVVSIRRWPTGSTPVYDV